MDLGLTKKVALITGGSGGIGRGLVIEFAREGCTVISADIDPGDALVAEARKQSLSGTVIPIIADITTRAGTDKLFAEIHKVAGPVDILVNNAGGAFKLGPAEDLADDNRVWNSAINIDGMINCTIAAGKDMLAKGKGSIINISSNAAVLGKAAHYTSHYAGVKGFVNSYGRGVATEWGERGVRVNTICPGLIVPHSNSHVPGKGSWWNRPSLPDAGKPEDFANDISDDMYRNSGAIIRRVGRPEDIAHLALYFASDVSSYVTGQIVSVSGGGYMP